MKSLKIEETTVGLDSTTCMEGKVDDLENTLYGQIMPFDLAKELEPVAADNLDELFSEEGEGGSREDSGGYFQDDSKVTTNIHIGINVSVDKPSPGDDSQLGIVKDSSVTSV